MDNVYSLYDLKAGVYSAPFLAQSDDEAKRILLDICLLGGDNLIARHTEDYELIRVGAFDKHNGLISPEEVNKFVESAQNLVRAYREKITPPAYDNDLQENSESEEVSVVS